MRSVRYLLNVLMAIAFASVLAVHAQTWPSQPIRIVVPFPPGGTTDQIARLIQPQLQKALGVSVVVDNRGGASGAIGSGVVAKAPPDGYTYLLVFDTHGVNPSLIPNMPFDTLKDLAPMMLIGKAPMVITVYPSLPYRTFSEVLRLARERPGEVTYGTIGTGSLAHLAITTIGNRTRTEMTHVPYKGGGPLIVAALGGQIPIAIASIALLSPSIQAGRLRAVAMTSPRRHPQYPGVATVAEQGVPGFEAEAWWGLLAPAGTPAPIISRMNAEVVKALKSPTVQQQLDLQALNVLASPPEEFGKFIAIEVERWARVVKENRIKPGD